MIDPRAQHFRCSSCAECCRKLRVAITHHDLARLERATGEVAELLVEWLDPGSVDMEGEPESFVELSRGRRLMVLAHGGQGCAFLQLDRSCAVYEHRPADCRAFPFDLTRDDRDVRRLELLPLEGCAYEQGKELRLDELARVDAERWDELKSYQSRVASWNHGAKHRRRLGKPLGGPDAFLAFLGFTRTD